MRSGQPNDKREEIQKLISKGSKLIGDAKRYYFLTTGNTLANPGTSGKRYRFLIDTVLNKARIPIILPILETGLFVTDFGEKARSFNGFFIL